MTLNLARKWRSKTFDQIIGQQLSISMLKNSLYLNYYFPVYLLSGQRGCGKTTTARVFAAALNCQELPLFQQQAHKSIPCLQCPSCQAMNTGQHPDFIEIDAASHTGVDNVRTIIEAASLMPVMGRKKIYLIDEAHMLSKAAFNAFLKILEEPPTSVLFMLATTDPHKIIDTIKSRCFQLFFPAVSSEHLVGHLAMICQQEGINYEESGLQLIVKQSQRCVRDAINLLEQVRFATGHITKASVISVSGLFDSNFVIELFILIAQGDVAQLLKQIRTYELEQWSAEALWDSCIEIVRLGLWRSYGIKEIDNAIDVTRLDYFVQLCSSQILYSMMQLLYEQELIFLKTASQHRFLEALLIRMCQKMMTIPEGPEPIIAQAPTHVKTTGTQKKEIIAIKSTDERWISFLQAIAKLDDPLLISIFKQGSFSSFNEETKSLDVIYAPEFSFFKEWLDNTRDLWKPLLESSFTANAVFNPLFTGATSNREKEISTQEGAKVPVPTVTKKIHDQTRTKIVLPNKKNEYSAKKSIDRAIDISDTSKWQTTHLLLKIFPGNVREIEGES